MGYLSYHLLRKSDAGDIYYETDTGLPCVFVDGKKVYVDKTSTILLPERVWKFSNLNGNHFAPYIMPLDRRMYTSSVADIAMLVEMFPSWEHVKASDEWEALVKHGWDESQHNAFKESLEWCVAQGGFYVTWGY